MSRLRRPCVWRKGALRRLALRLSAVGTTASVKSSLATTSPAFWNAHYGPQTAALVLTGDITEKRRTRRRTSTLACGRARLLPRPASVPEPATPERKVILVDKPGSPQTVLLAFGLGVPRSTPDYPASRS